MNMDSFSREELQESAFQLEQALYNHLQWYNALIRTFVCQLPSDKHDISDRAYQECRFGQWYYKEVPEKMREHPAFIALGEEHQKMHEIASKLLTTIEKGGAIRPFEYDNFSNALQRVQLEIAALQREINDMLYTRDSLTGAINRVNMLPALREQQVMVKRHIQACTLVMVDLDNFKIINDKYGHGIGDFTLTWLTQFLKEHLRPYDKIFRVGGEEFLICLQNTDTKVAFEIIERLRNEIGSSKIKAKKDKSFNLTVSFGIASLDADSSVEESLEHADQALYQAKHEGRNCTRIWS